MIQNKYAIGFLVSNVKFFKNMLKFFPSKGLLNSDIYLIVENRWKKDLPKSIFLELENNLFFKNKTKYIFTTKEVINFYSSYLNLQKFIVLNYSTMIFQMIINDFFTNILDYSKALVLDDDIFVLDDLEYLLKKEEEFLFIKSGFTILQNDEMIQELNKVFRINLRKEHYKKTNVSMGTMILSKDRKYKKYLKRILDSDYFNFLIKNRNEYGFKIKSTVFVQWATIPYYYILKHMNRNVRIITPGEAELAIVYSRKEKMYFLRDNMKINKKIWHYACGPAKDFFIDKFGKILKERGYLNA